MARFANANTVYGTSYDDYLTAEGGSRDSGEGYSTLYGGAGNDHLTGAGWESHLYGGAGEDKFALVGGTWVEDASISDKDTVYYNDVRLTGGIQLDWQNDGWAYSGLYDALAAAFPVIGRGLVDTIAMVRDWVGLPNVRYRLGGDNTLEIEFGYGHGGSAAIRNYDLNFDSGEGVGGLTVFNLQVHPGRDLASLRKFMNLAMHAGFGHGIYGFDPLVLDLNGDGLKLTTEINSKVYFDFDHNGFARHTGWATEGDGFLVHDANANGQIDDISEMFGNATQSGFDELSAYDSNGDGQITAADAQFADLEVWQDLDQDGVTDAGELKSLSDLGIVSISLAATAPATPTAIAGNEISEEATFTLATGEVRKIDDVNLNASPLDTRYLGDSTISSAAAALPDLPGTGQLAELRIAMTQNAALLASVSAFAGATSFDFAILQDTVAQILFQWAGVDSQSPQALGTHGFDTQKLAFLERYAGIALMPRDAAGVVQLTNLSEVEQLWNDQLPRLTLRLAIQGPLASTFGGIAYSGERDVFFASDADSLSNALHNLVGELSGLDHTQALTLWESMASLVWAVTEQTLRADGNVVHYEYLFQQLVRAADDVVQPLTIGELATVLSVPNLRLGTVGAETLTRSTSGDLSVFYGQGGDDALNGGAGQDAYVFGHTIGHAVITDYESNAAGDRILFAFLNENDVRITRDGHDLLVTVLATSETVRVVGQFADVIPRSATSFLSPNRGIEDIQFADGKVMSIPDIMDAVGTGTDGNDNLVGTMHIDVLTGRKGDDTLSGGDDGDIYVINAGDGHDTIIDTQTNPLLNAGDMVAFEDGIAGSDVTLSRQGAKGADLLMTIGYGSQSVLIKDAFGYSVLGYDAPFALNSRIEFVAFKGAGDSWSLQDIQDKLIAAETTSGNDVTHGFGADDQFVASAGNDVLIGMDGADTYQWGGGAGNDTIDEQADYIDITVGLEGISLTVKADTVRFLSDITPTNVTFARLGANPDLRITDITTGETLTIKEQFHGIQTGILGGQWMQRVEWFEFANGTRLSWQDVEALVTTGGDGDDALYGDILQDQMKGGKGDDYLAGGGGADTYHFNVGDGHDTVEDSDSSFLTGGFLTIDPDPDVLKLGAGITQSDISFVRNGPDVDLVIGSSGDRVTLKGQDSYIYTGVFGNLSSTRVEEIHFDDGAIWTWHDLNVRMIAAATTAGNDHTVGTSTDDVFLASAGDDILDGADGNDTYMFGRGSGHDVIRDRVDNVMDGENDVLSFASGVSLADLTFARDGNDLVITITDSGDSIRVENQFQWDAWYSWHDVETFAFADGSSLTDIDVQVRLLQPTAGDDTLIGFSTNDDLDGQGGNDVLIGGDGADTYHFGRGYGHDTIQESVSYALISDADRLVFGANITRSDLGLARDGDDLVITILDTQDTMRIAGQFHNELSYVWNDVELFQFADGSSMSDLDVKAVLAGGTEGNDHIIGFSGADTLDGRGGDDILEGKDGNDIYLFGRGSGHDIVHESVDYIFNGEFDRLVFGSGITLADLGFARDGEDLVITILDTQDTMRISGQFHNDLSYMWHDVELFQFADGTSLTDVEVKALLANGSGSDDHIIGYSGHDVLDGGAGNDLLEGLDGNDTYIFGRGYGHDTVREQADYIFNGQYDRISLRPGITLADLGFSREGDDLIVSIRDTGDSIRVEGHFEVQFGGYTWRSIEQIDFSDGTSISKNDIPQLLLHGSSGADHIIGYSSDDAMEGGAGNDVIEGGAGADTYTYNPGDGDDTYIDNEGSSDIVDLGAGITPGDVQLGTSATNPSDMILRFAGIDGSVTLRNQLYDGPGSGIDSIKFADGTIWDRATLNNHYFAAIATSGADTLQGTWISETIDGGAGNDVIAGDDGNDLLIGGTGNDDITGGAGGDTYVFNAGDGRDIIRDTSGANTLRFGAGITPDDVLVSTAHGGADYTLKFVNEASDRVVIDQGISDSDAPIDRIEFADGTVWLTADLAARVAYHPNILTGTDDADVVVGFDDSDLIDGRGGDDLLQGTDGSDVYRFGIGGGHDVIEEDGADSSVDTDVVELSVASTEVDGTRDGRDVILTIRSTGETVTLRNQFADGFDALSPETGSETGIETVKFSDGVEWSAADIAQHAWYRVQAGASDLPTTTNDETIVSAGATDYIFGVSGHDTLDYTVGDGNVRAYIGRPSAISPAGQDNIELRLHGVALADLQLSLSDTFANEGTPFRSNMADLDIRFDGSEALIKLWFYLGQADPADFADDFIVLDDGSRHSIASLLGGLDLVGTDADDSFSASNLGSGVVRGGLGDDSIYFVGDGNVAIWSPGDGNDHYIQARGTGALKLIGVNQADATLTASGADLVITVGDEEIIIKDQLGSVVDSFDYSALVLSGMDIQFADQTVTREDLAQSLGFTTTAANNDYWRGHDFAETVRASQAGAYILTYGGDDVIYADQGGYNQVDTGDGNDRVFFSSGAGYALMGSGNDVLTVLAGEASDNMVANLGDGDDQAFGSDESDTFFGGSGDDTLNGGNGNDNLFGDEGDDTLDAGNGDDQLFGHEGNDVLIAGVGNIYISGGDGNDTLTAAGGNAVLSGDAGDDILHGGADNDVLLGGDGDDTLVGGAGDDQVSGDDGNDTLFGGAGDDQVSGGGGNDTLVGDAGDDQVIGGDGDDTLVGGAGDDQVIGADGDDTLFGGAGSDQLIGLLGDDSYNYAIGDGNDVIIDTGGADVVVLGGGIAEQDVTFGVSEGGGDLVLSFAGTADQLTVAGALFSEDRRIEEIRFGSGTILTYADILAQLQTPVEGRDFIASDFNADTLDTQGIAHRVFGNGGGDTFVFNRGYGAIDIVEYDAAATPSNRLLMGADIDPDDVTVVSSSDGTYTIRFNEDYRYDNTFEDGDSVSFKDGKLYPGSGVQSVEFADGTIWDLDELRTLADTGSPTQFEINGSDADETFDGLGYTKIAAGGGGSDTYAYKAGYGALGSSIAVQMA